MPTQWYDGQTDQLSDAIGSNPDNNTAGYVVDKMYPGLLGGMSTCTTGCTSGITTKAQRREKQISSCSTNSPLGNYSQSPIHWVGAITGLVDRIPQFFKPNANEYTNSLVDARRPQKTQPAKAVSPQDTYDKFYQRLRDFARAEETADRGRVQIRNT